MSVTSSLLVYSGHYVLHAMPKGSERMFINMAYIAGFDHKYNIFVIYTIMLKVESGDQIKGLEVTLCCHLTF